ncbi:ankyrin repeat domain-containing protein [Duganella sp. FT94W]|uniref:Ankyrin repeat domain-containing protein n=1 Tax=Duganella lactea TaxID=2692173 RepID=A0ABW9V686_9BURK|nr:ankyrin repeat domain-containing protein [Duganella lactea]MYM35098.1 ankyrin repeat domain-containing protein [Duganella lactea]
MMTRRLVMLALAAAVALPSWAAQQTDDEVDFIRAAQLDGVDRVKKALSRGVNPNTRDSNGETGLIIAMRYESLKVARLLMDTPGIDLEAKAPNGNTALMMAAFRNNRAAVMDLLNHGAQVNQKGWTALHYAAAAGSVEITSLLLENHAYIDAETPTGMTPLMIAAREGQEDVVGLLLVEGADATLQDRGFHLTAAGFALKAEKPWIAKSINAFLAKKQ